MNYDMFRHREILCDMMHLEKQRREEIAMQKKKRASEKVKKQLSNYQEKLQKWKQIQHVRSLFINRKKLKVLRSCGSFEFDNISDRLFSRW